MIVHGAEGATNAQEAILRECAHREASRSEVDMGHGERLPVCVDCWNRSVQARKAGRKASLMKYWAEYAAAQSRAMAEVGASVGQRVERFFPSMLGEFFGGLTLHGRIIRNRNGVAIVKLDSPYNGKTTCSWSVGWRPASRKDGVE